MILGTLKPAGGSLEKLFVCRNVVQGALLIMCNQGGAASKVRVEIVPDDGVPVSSNYIYYDYSMNANTTLLVDPPITLESRDAVHVYSDTGDVSFNLLG